MIQATGVGKDLVLSRIVQMVAEVQRSRAPIQRLADVVAKYFVPAIECEEGCSSGDLLALAAAVERQSEHPLAEAIVRKAQVEQLAIAEAEGFQSITGGGVMGTVEGREVMIGSVELLAGQGVSRVDPLLQHAARHQQSGGTVILVSVDGSAAAAIAISDPVKESHTHARGSSYEGSSHDRVWRYEDSDGALDRRRIFADGLQQALAIALSQDGRVLADDQLPPESRAMAVRYLSGGDLGKATPKLLLLARSGDPVLAAEAIRTLATAEDSIATATLIAVASDPDEEIPTRCEAIMALAAGESRDVSPILPRLAPLARIIHLVWERICVRTANQSVSIVDRRKGCRLPCYNG